MVSTLKNVCSSMPRSARIGVAISETDSIVNARPMGLQKWISRPLAQAAPPQLVLDQEGNLQRRGRALVGHRRDADDDPSAGERVERGPQSLRRIGSVEVMRLGLEVLDRLGQDARARSEHELVVVQAASVFQLDQLARLVDPLHATDFEAHLGVQQRPLRPHQVLGHLAAHGDVHEPGLVDVLAAARPRRSR